jgi:hypothetical protein
MKKPKLKLDSATIQTFLVRHVEKIVLVLVVGGWFTAGQPIGHAVHR